MEKTNTDKAKLLKWLLKRKRTTDAEHASATTLQMKINKGAKLCVYKECIAYVTAHTSYKRNDKDPTSRQGL